MAVVGACGPRQRSVKGPFVYSETVSRPPFAGLGSADEIVDQLHLVILVLGREALARVGHRHVLAHEGLAGLDVGAHMLLDCGEVLGGDRGAFREIEVVVEAALDRRPDRDLHAGVELHHGRGEHMGGVVTDQAQRLLASALGGEDRDLRAVGKRACEIAQLRRLPGLGMGHLDRQRRTREAWPNRGGGVDTGGAVVKLEGRAVGEFELDRHDCRGAY